MLVHGFQKTTLLDYPGHLAATVFLAKCNFCCPFCHNSGLVLASDQIEAIEDSEVLKTLNKRKGILEGVCVTGGEPTLNPELPSFLRSIKELGLKVKLDTNGYKPDILGKLLEDGLVDYVAMDIKSGRDNYANIAGVKSIDIKRIEESVSLISNRANDYEFRTTYVKGLHTEEDVYDIGEWLAGDHKYFIQNYKEVSTVISPVYDSFSDWELKRIKEILSKSMTNVHIRGDYQ